MHRRARDGCTPRPPSSFTRSWLRAREDHMRQCQEAPARGARERLLGSRYAASRASRILAFRFAKCRIKWRGIVSMGLSSWIDRWRMNGATCLGSYARLTRRGENGRKRVRRASKGIYCRSSGARADVGSVGAQYDQSIRHHRAGSRSSLQPVEGILVYIANEVGGGSTSSKR